MRDGEPPLERPGDTHAPSTTTEDPPRELDELFLWLRDTVRDRYRALGRPIPDDGMTQQMLARCLSAHGFKCNQSRISRMEHGESWPGIDDKAEVESFVDAAKYCYALDGTGYDHILRIALLIWGAGR